MPDDRRARIEQAIRDRLSAVHVEVIDESHLHAGHAGAASGGGHFRATVVSSLFEGKNSVARQRLVYTALAVEMTSDIHALSLKTLTPEQFEADDGKPT